MRAIANLHYLCRLRTQYLKVMLYVDKAYDAELYIACLADN